MSIEGLSQCTLNNTIQSNSVVQMSFENTLVILLPPLYKANWKRKTAVDNFFFLNQNRQQVDFLFPVPEVRKFQGSEMRHFPLRTKLLTFTGVEVMKSP